MLVIMFRARHHFCAIPVAQVAETMRPLPIERLAGVKDHILGLSVIRGASVPVVDVGALLGGGTAHTTQFILLKVEERHVALAVEDLLGVRPVSSRALADMPPLLGEASHELVRSIGACDGAFLLLLQEARLLVDLPESAMGAPHA